MTFTDVLRKDYNQYSEGVWIKRAGWKRYIWVSNTGDPFTANVGIQDFLATDWEQLKRPGAQTGSLPQEKDETATRFSLLEID